MPNLELKFSVSDMTLELIEQLRAGRSREAMLRHVMELGFCELIEAATRTHRDYTAHIIAGQTKDYRQARHKLFAVEEPESTLPQRLETARTVTQR